MSIPAPEGLRAIAEELAREAGGLLHERFLAGRTRAVASKSTPTDLVSEADLASERAIRERLARLRPEDGLLGEEGGDSVIGTSGLRWVVDPLDGTINFLFGIPHWCVSVAVQDAGGITLAGVVFDPLRDELFAACREGPATVDGVALERPERPGTLDEAMVATGFAYDATVRAAQAQVIAGLLARVRDVRRLGAAALDLAWTAAGRYDAYFERTVKLWDIAAGQLLCERMGVEVRALPEAPGLPWGIMVASPAIARELYALISEPTHGTA
ncbi:MAG TPA: inositol monophosphatase family protein [Solirubrobacteraceae bacterium]|nr:inositol monophosphatase family protein [Solirubrobacteraceae bacterium]